ncbi:MULTISPECIES: hypothetical protein [Bacillaceae]|uniref:Uncharacterized protein n=1 Tax=Domibacillus aminovorans TaxID=29332 RepID=A0A177KR74_9BACI|nr:MULTISPECIES: hypothetical protein [Bacillaceae]OAH55863.1 hypothetical protein AWH48_04090 [Domibacillus aminovorans]OAH58258.1 hypothetical protein AWH49_06100 [Domibacillus aminovorans]
MTKEEWMERLAEIEQETLELEKLVHTKVAAERHRQLFGMRVQKERIQNRLLLVEEGARFLCGEPDIPSFMSTLKPAAGSM